MLKHWYELDEPTPIVERGGRRYHDEVAVEPVYVYVMVPTSTAGGYNYYNLSVQGPNGEMLNVRGKEKPGFTAQFIALQEQIVYCAVNQDQSGNLQYCLMPRPLKEANGAAPPQSSVGNSAPSTTVQPSVSTGELLTRKDELSCWAISEANRIHSKRWDIQRVKECAEALLALQEGLRNGL